MKTKEVKRAEAKARQAGRERRDNVDQLVKLAIRLGVGGGAKRERRLLKREG